METAREYARLFDPWGSDAVFSYVFTSRNAVNCVRAKTSRVHDHISVIANAIDRRQTEPR
jgi:hypothetical protein